MNEIEPGEDVFSEDDLGPTDEDVRAHRRMQGDRAATTIAVTALGLWAGGLIALGACAAPFVFKLTPYPLSGMAMGAAFARFDTIAIACGVVVLGCEVMRTLIARGRATALAPRIRRGAAIILAVGALYGGVQLTPAIMELHREGARRNVGADGARLEQLHKQAEMIGKLTVPAALALIALHVFTLRVGNEDDWGVTPGVGGAAGERPQDGDAGHGHTGHGETDG
jgi:hypothetical protein